MLFSLDHYRFSWFVSPQLRVTAPVADKGKCLSESHKEGWKCQVYRPFPSGNKGLASSSSSLPPHSCHEQEVGDSASICKGAWEGTLNFPTSVVEGSKETGSG